MADLSGFDFLIPEYRSWMESALGDRHKIISDKNPAEQTLHEELLQCEADFTVEEFYGPRGLVMVGHGFKEGQLVLIFGIYSGPQVDTHPIYIAYRG